MQSLTQRIWSAGSRWHVGDVAWGRASTSGDWRTAIWSDEGECVAWGWAELPGELNLVVDRAYPALVTEVISWFGEVAHGSARSCTVLEPEEHLVDGLRAAGFLLAQDQHYFRSHSMSLDDLVEPVLPPDFVLRHVEPADTAARAAVHRAGWSDFRSSMTTARYARVMAAWPYRHDLDWVVVAPDGELVASALGWLDDVNQVGLLEPVGCAASYRRLGLARAASLACLRAMRSLGARTGHVNPRGDEAYPVPGRLYRGIGFQPGARTLCYEQAG